jgi:hypothetical protein
MLRLVSKILASGPMRTISPCRSGRSPDWRKSKNPACEAVRREAEEDGGYDDFQGPDAYRLSRTRTDEGAIFQ